MLPHCLSSGSQEWGKEKLIFFCCILDPFFSQSALFLTTLYHCPAWFCFLSDPDFLLALQTRVLANKTAVVRNARSFQPALSLPPQVQGQMMTRMLKCK